MAQIKPVLACGLTAGLCAVLIMILDTVTGVPFNYAVPIALILSMLPYGFWLLMRHGEPTRLRAEASTESRVNDGESGMPAFSARGRMRHPSRRWKRPATIHSIVFTPVVSGDARQERSTQEV